MSDHITVGGSRNYGDHSPVQLCRNYERCGGIVSRMNTSGLCQRCANVASAHVATRDESFAERRARFDAAWDSGLYDHAELFFVLAREDRLPPAGHVLCRLWWRATDPARKEDAA